MNPILEELWYSYIMENSIEENAQSKKLLRTLVEKQDYLKDNLDPEVFKICEECHSIIFEMGGISEKEAFVKGVQFATGYLVEALHSKTK